MDNWDSNTQRKLERFIKTEEYEITGVILQHKESKRVTTICNGKVFWPSKITSQCITGAIDEVYE